MNNLFLAQDEIAAINALMPGTQLYGVGDKLANALQGAVPIGKKFFLDPVNGADTNDGLSTFTAKKTLPAAYALLTANQNDTLYIIGGSSALNLTAAFTWDKSYTHCIGLAGNLRFGGRVRIGHAGTAMSPMFTISGSGCIFHNIHWQHGQASATNLICLDISGARNHFSNCHIEGSLDTVASGGSYSWRAVKIESGAQANTFSRCTLGSWTVVWASANGLLVLFDGDNADTWFDDCILIGNTSSTSMKFIGFTGPISGAYSMIGFTRCKFIATNAAPAVAIGTPTNGNILIDNCSAMNITAYGGVSTQFWVNGPAGNKLGGVAVNIT